MPPLTRRAAAAGAASILGAQFAAAQPGLDTTRGPAPQQQF